MKKTSSIILILAMLLTSFMSLFAVGVNAADGDVLLKLDSDFNHVAYEFSNDAAAIDGGAIAKFTVTIDGNQKTAYIKTLDTAFAFSGDEGVKADVTDVSTAEKIAIPKEFTFVKDSITVSGTGDASYYSGVERGITFNGLPGSGTTIDFNERRVNFNEGLTCFNNVTLTGNGRSSDRTFIQIQDGVTFVLGSGSSIIQKADYTPTYATVIVKKGSTLTINEGALIKNSASSANETKGSAIRINADNAKINVNGGKIQSTGVCIHGTAGNNFKIKITGGELYSTQRSAIYCTAKGELSISDAIIKNDATSTDDTYATIYHTGGNDKDKGIYSTKSFANTTITAGGAKALYLHSGSISNIDNCTVTGATYVYGGVPSVNGSTFTAKGTAPAYTIGAATTNFINCTLSAENASALYLKLDRTQDLWSAASIEGTTLISTGAAAIKADAGVSGTFIKSGTFMGKDNLSAVYVEQAVGSTGNAISLGDKALEDKITVSKLIDGASVRTVKDSSGIRFQSKISKADYDALIEAYGAANVQFGTIIAPKDKITGVFTKEALGEGNYLDIPAVNGINETEEGYVINAVMTKVKTENYTRDFAAIPYVTVTTDNGTVTAYGTWNEEDNVRNIREVAYKALEDVLYVGKVVDEVTVDAQYIENAKGYKNKVTSWYENGVLVTAESKGVEFGYTCYSTAQRDVIDDYLA